MSDVLMQRSTLRRVGYRVLCLGPFLVVPLISIRELRAPGLYQTLGFLIAGVVGVCAWWISRSSVTEAHQPPRHARLAGWLLLLPFMLMGLLWVGLATPWDATPTENQMRYAVLLAASVAITGGFVQLREGLKERASEASSLGLAAGLLSGGAYVVWTAFQLGYYALIVSDGDVPPAVATINNVLDALLFAATALGYLTTAAFAYALGRADWLGQRMARIYVTLNCLALGMLMLRGVSFPNPDAGPEPWYTQPGFVVGIPAVPWIMPFLLGVVILRRVGDGEMTTGSSVGNRS